MRTRRCAQVRGLPVAESRIYTKLGDDGSTGLLFGGRTAKSDPLVDTLGSIDETVAALGTARAACSDRVLAATILRIQRDLFVVAADLAANPRARDRLVPGVSLVTPAMTARVEQQIDEVTAAHPLRPVFVVPGANPVSAALDVARTIVRRAERRLVGEQPAERDRLAGDGPVGDSADRDHPGRDHRLAYLNRVSDLLFVLARQSAGDDEEPVSHED